MSKGILIIDPSQTDVTHLLFISDHEPIADEHIEGSHRKLLEIIDSFLHAHKIQRDDINAIGVVLGAGRFSSTRIAATIANAWHAVHRIPVFGLNTDDVLVIQTGRYPFEDLKKNGYLSPTYSAPPHIGKPKHM